MEGEWPLHIPTALLQGKRLGRTVYVAAGHSRFVSKRILTLSEIEPRSSFRLALSLFTILSYVCLFREGTWLELSPILGVRVL
jgi:hypothetical protein